jgi:pimeloyl-ACP methyl ester carboxylesterase
MEGMRLPDMPAESYPDRIEAWARDVRRARAAVPRVYPTLEDAARRLRDLDPLCPDDEARTLAELGTRPVAGGRSFLHDPLHLTRSPYPFRADQSVALLARVTCPVLLLEGSESEDPPVDYPRRLAALRDARRVVIGGAGHMLMRHRPEAVAKAIVDFLAE